MRLRIEQLSKLADIEEEQIKHYYKTLLDYVDYDKEIIHSIIDELVEEVFYHANPEE
jgi:hypothetical protein